MQKVSLRGRLWQCSKHRCTRDPNWKVRIHIQPNPLLCWQKSHARETIQRGRCYLKEIRLILNDCNPMLNQFHPSTRPVDKRRDYCCWCCFVMLKDWLVLLVTKITLEFFNWSVSSCPLCTVHISCKFLVGISTSFGAVPWKNIWGSTEKPQSFGFLVRAPSAVVFFSCGGGN